VAFSRWDPFRDLVALQNELGELGRLVTTDVPTWTPPVDLYETASAFVLEAELPGLTRDQIDIHAEEHLIVVRGHRNSRPAGSPGSDVSCEQYHRLERGHGHFSRAFTLPAAVNVQSVTAELRDGILVVTLPKLAPPAPRRVNVS
jgi:HSP20 family protein